MIPFLKEAVTQLFSKPSTEGYPFTPKEAPIGYRGRIVFHADQCISCGMCERVCPCGAMHVIDKQAAIDYTRCISCGMCATKCPKHVIHDRLGIFAAAE